MTLHRFWFKYKESYKSSIKVSQRKAILWRHFEFCNWRNFLSNVGMIFLRNIVSCMYVLTIAHFGTYALEKLLKILKNAQKCFCPFCDCIVIINTCIGWRQGFPCTFEYSIPNLGYGRNVKGLRQIFSRLRFTLRFSMKCLLETKALRSDRIVPVQSLIAINRKNNCHNRIVKPYRNNQY